MRSAWMSLIVLFFASCYDSGQGCNLNYDTCHDDFDCAAESICDVDGLFSPGKSCIPAVLCSTDLDCSPSERCVSRPSVEPDHPFEWKTPGKSVCECEVEPCDDTSSSTSTTSSSSTTTSASGTGGGGGGGGGTNQGGAGGAGGAP